jgi:hypothetical protein
MALLTINRNPSTRELRSFGLLFFPAFLAMVAWISYRASGSWIGPGICAGLAFSTVTMAVTVPAALRSVWLLTMCVTYPIGFVISHILMAFAYYLVLTPAGVLLRLAKGDPLRRAADPAARSYWVRRPEQPDPERYFRQF